MKKSRNKRILIGLALILTLALAACGGAETASAEKPQQTTAVPVQTDPPAPDAVEEQTDARPEDPASTPAPAESTAAAPAGKDTLVVYFSATGTTKAVAEQIAALTDAELYEIQAAQPYTEADLNWHDSGSRTTIEQNDKGARPEIGSEPISLEGYTTIYIGYPIWWGEEPRILDTFVEAYDFDGMTLIPFCTSSSSGLGRSGQNLAENAGSGNWLEGKRFGAGPSEDALREWIEGLN
jgi:flavodoxin